MLPSYMKSRNATSLLIFFLILTFVAYAQSGSSTSVIGTVAVSYTHLTLPTTPYV